MKMIASVVTGIRGLSARNKGAVVLAISMLAAVLILAGCGKDDTTPTFPQPIPPEAGEWLFDVYGTGPNDVYACGNSGAMFRSIDGGSTWTSVSSGTNLPIVRIWGPGDGTLYACGHGGKIWRNTSGTWNAMDSGTAQNLYGLGEYQDEIYACGYEGTLRKLVGGGWGGTASDIILRDTASGTPTDTLTLTADIASLVTINAYFIGGAYFDPAFEGEMVGIAGTKGMVLAPDDQYTPSFPWLLRPISGDPEVDAEWVICTTSSTSALSNNYLGTSEGWLFQLTRDTNERLVWSKTYPDITEGVASAIRDMWLDNDGNLYMVTDDGEVVYQTADGERSVLYNRIESLVGIWGTGPDNLFVVGYMDNLLLRCNHDPVAETFVVTEVVIPPFPDKAGALPRDLDEYDRPLGR